MGKMGLWRAVLLGIACCLGGPAQAGEITLGVAANFIAAAEALAAEFERGSGHTVRVASGSTGKLYTQIRHGAPFDLFFAADVRRPRLLEEAGVALAGSRFTYAVGRVVLWSPRPGYVDADGAVLERGGFAHLAMANPRLAPYGAAARQVLEARGLWQALQGRLVRGENIGQTFQFVVSGNAELGFVALSQVRQPGVAQAGSYWAVPQALYAPIEQQAVLLRDSPAARAFLAFVRSERGRALIREYGYGTP